MSAPGASLTARDEAAAMLMRSSFVAGMDLDEARLVIDAMRPVFMPAGTVVMREGQTEDADYMALVLDGQVRAESSAQVPGQEVVMSIIGPGQLIGEMGLLDGEPRSATCTALTDLRLALLTRAALRRLVEVQPAVAARLMLGIAEALAERVRAGNRRYQALSRVMRAVQLELDATHAVNLRLLEQQDQAAPRR
ncbi:cyclic nucleotide-binding domain-containing protein [Xenophilus arseniciresistens]|uniref:Cyclic nucleotide-binding domain-containing protein n=1 Tax=Xenophilus arseniciresistens TaxID=1283306 RepID=A0AAE3NAQ0_9BURK|nr:cyclic nucleotide-binding domain-containing protein [Xenophilus arseniciresistens]MDA7418870.1 cyclic nucleotide-binding domain-containing protein [Xenophilus arseniciresistens]